MKTNELTGTALNWAVAKCEGLLAIHGGNLQIYRGQLKVHPSSLGTVYTPSTDWAQGGPIIEREGITVIHIGEDWEDTWQARKGDGHWQGYLSGGQTPLIAAMRCYVASTLGVEVDIPEELTS